MDTTYTATVSAAPFRRCDYRTLGLNPLCNPASFDEEGGFSSINPPIWGTPTFDEYRQILARGYKKSLGENLHSLSMEEPNRNQGRP